MDGELTFDFGREHDNFQFKQDVGKTENPVLVFRPVDIIIHEEHDRLFLAGHLLSGGQEAADRLVDSELQDNR